MSVTTKERPIIFSGPMVKAILDGRKTQTRRVCKEQPPPCHGYPRFVNGEWGIYLDRPHAGPYKHLGSCPRGVPGDRLWIKSEYRTRFDQDRNETYWSVDGVGFITTHGEPQSGTTGRRKRDGNHPAMFMPNWLSQELKLPLLEITDVRVERLQSISEDDAIAEGIEYTGDRIQDGKRCSGSVSVVGMFRELWHTIHAADGPNGWESSPFVWAISFKRLEAG